MELQHKLAVKLAEIIDKNGTEESNMEERMLLIYGIEIFLNEFLKLMFILLFAIIVNKAGEAVFFMVYLLVARKLAGGRHCKNNLMCLLVTFFTAFAAPVAAVRMTVGTVIQISLFIGELVVTLLILPYIKKEEEPTKEERRKRKVSAGIMFSVFILLARLLGGIPYVNGMLAEHALILISALPEFKKKNKMMPTTDL